MQFCQWITAIALSVSSGLWLGSTTQASPLVPQSGSATQVQQTGNEFTITGGIPSADGQSLFHAFEQLGLSQGQIASFLAQPEVQSILGSVVGGEASYIDGLLRVAGSSADLYLVNPAGILLGPHAQLDLAGSFAATTANGILFDEAVFNVLSGDDFSQVSGRPTGFVFATDEAGAVVNAADLQVAAGQSITLIGGQVISTGSLTAPGGEITIAAIPEANLVRISHPDMVLNLEVTTLPADAIAADTALSPLTLPALLTGAPAAIATGLAAQPDGTVALVNTETELPHGAGTAIASGHLNVSGTAGGDVAVVGDRVALLDATVDASGSNGGGTVRVGGDWQGQGTLPGSQITYVDGETAILANAGTVGDGGTVILWSDGATAFYGDIAAAGGSSAGDGGFVEVSGQETLVYRGTVTAIAPNGQIGTLLLDPTDVTIRNGTADGDDSGGNALQLAELTFAAADAIPTVIYESELENTLGNIDLGIRASNDIILEDLADDALTFLTDPINPGSITFEAGNEFRFVDSNDTIVAPRRALTVTADNITAGSFDITDSNPGGTISLTASGAIVMQGARTFLGDILITGSSIQASNILVDTVPGETSPDSSGRVELTATGTDVIVGVVFAAGGGLEIDAARQFQAINSDVLLLSTALEAGDTELIEFLSKGDPDLLTAAGLVDTPGLLPNESNTAVLIPMSVRAIPDDEGDAPISIRHGGQANTISLDGGNVLIQGSGAFPDIQFIVGPLDDHDITITNPGTPGVVGTFDNFSTLFPAGTFSSTASGAIGAIVRQATDSTLVTSFQNQPFVPMPISSDTGTPSTGGANLGGRDIPIAPTLEFENATLENLAPNQAEAAAAETAANEEAVLLAPDEETEDCEAAIANRSTDTIEITSTCPAPAATDSEN